MGCRQGLLLSGCFNFSGAFLQSIVMSMSGMGRKGLSPKSGRLSILVKTELN